MKKNLFLSLFTLATMLFTACQEEDLAGAQSGNTAAVTFEVSTPALAAHTRAGEGEDATKLYVAVYENQNGTLAGPLEVSLIDEGETVALVGKKATVNLQLVKNKEYSIIFWAETGNNDEAIFDFDWTTRQFTLKSELKANQEKYDAFWAQKTVTLNGALSETVELTRPFAQLNIGTSDKDAAEAAGIVVTESQVIVKEIPTTFDLQTGEVSGAGTVTYVMESVEDLEGETFPADGYSYLSLNYLLMGDKQTVDVAFSYMDEEDAAPYELSFPSVPVQRNYRTNIYGTLLTNSANYTVEIKPGFGNDGQEDAANIVYVTTAEELAAALTADKKDISVVTLNDIDLPISSLGAQTPGSGEYKLGGADTKNITIDLNGKTLNLTTGYMSAIGAINPDATITIKNGTMTSTGNKATTWNINDVTFANCNYVIENVTFNKEVALTNAGKSVAMNNVTINGTGDYYALWISAKGQTLDIDGLTVNTIGRGIKIDEQYVAAPAKVTLNISNSTFETNKKAAIMVKSMEGAEITVENVNIENVAADPFFAVWVDSDSKEYADKVIVNGANMRVEDENSEVDGSTVVVVSTAEELNSALSLSENITIVLAKGEFGTIVAKGNKTIVGSELAKVECVNLNGADNLTLKNIKFDAATAKLGYDGKGKGKQYANIITGNNTNKPNKGAHNLVIDGCTFQGTFTNAGAAIAFTDQGRSGGGSGNVTIRNCVFNTVGGYYDIYGHYFGDGTNGHGNFTIEGNTFKTTFTQGLPVYLGRYASSTPVVVKGNIFETVTSLDDAVYVQDHSNYGVSIASESNTFAQE